MTLAMSEKIERGYRVRVKRFGDIGTVISIHDLGAGRLLTLRLDMPDRFGCNLTTEWERDVEICHGEAVGA